MDKTEEIAKQIIYSTLGDDYKTIHIGRAIEVLNKQFIYKQDIEKLKREIMAKLDEYAQQVAEKQRQRDRAVYSINKTKTSIEIRQAILDAPLVTEKTNSNE